jgi:hypothetical protein
MIVAHTGAASVVAIAELAVTTIIAVFYYPPCKGFLLGNAYFATVSGRYRMPILPLEYRNIYPTFLACAGDPCLTSGGEEA